VEETHFDILSSNQLLSRLDRDEMEELLSLAAIEEFRTNDVILHKGDPGDRLYAILSGRVGINTVSREGKELFLNILDPGEVFGEIAVLDGKERTAGAKAIRPTKLISIGRSEFLQFLERHPKLSLRLIEVLCERLRWTSDIIENTIFLQIPRRLAKRLVTLVERLGRPVDPGNDKAGIRIDMKLSQEDLGNMLGVTRESINKGLRSLQQSGVLSHEAGYIIVHDLEALKDLINHGALD
jgi:CRP-like cAMP-binding protein